MTVIAWDGKTLAADRRMTNNGLIRTTTKVRRIGTLRAACAGNMDAAEEMFAWINRGRSPSDFPAMQSSKDDWCSCVVIEADDSVVTYERSPYPTKIADSVYASGSGRDFALAAMHLGKTAAEAVLVASHFQCDCGNGVDVLA